MRMLFSTSSVLAASILVFRLPFAAEPDRIGWRVSDPDEIVAIEEVRFEEGLSAPAAPRPTVFDFIPDVVTDADDEGEGGDAQLVEEEAAPDESGNRLGIEPMQRIVLAAAERMPEIQGGLGAYYINIAYPQAAIEAGVEGRLVLDFIVEPDGRPTEIEIYKSLHPLCDSAAVRALRMTRFMPGRHDGEVVAVRMRLPVLFQLLNRPSTDSTGVGTP